MELKELDPAVTLKLLEGCRDVISPLAREREQLYQNQVCIRCGSEALVRVGNSRTMFRNGDPLPRFQMKCRDCECVFDPHTGILLAMGNIGKAFVPSIPILKGPED